MQKIFVEFDYDNKTVKRYTREGMCNFCGDCCKQLIYIANSSTEMRLPEQYQHARWMQAQDEELPDTLMQYHVTGELMDKPCNLLVEINGGNLCSTQNVEKLEVCTLFPMSPEHLAKLPNCSYTFDLLDEHPMEDG